MIDAAIGTGANIFITMVIILISFVAGVMALDSLKSFKKKDVDE